MKIAFVAYDRPRYRAGPIVNARRLLPELAKRGHEVTALILYKEASPASEWLESQGVQVVAAPFPKTTEDQIEWFLSSLEKINPDVFVPNLSTAGWFAARWCREAGIATIAAHRSDDAYHWGMVEQFVVGPKQWAVNGCVCVSKDLTESVRKLNPKHTKIKTICSGVPVPCQVANTCSRPFRIAYVGRLEQVQKRILDTVSGLVEVLRSDKRFEATIIGEGSKRAEVEQLVRDSDVGDRFRILGAIEPHLLHQELLQHQALVLLSDFEGLPGSVMDAMACGLVPVCSRFAGIDELVVHRETGLIVDDRQDSLVSGMQVIANDTKLWEKLSKAARGKIESGFMLSQAAERWEEFCLQLTEGQRKRPISVPTKFDLPPVHPGLAREDIRAGLLNSMRRGVANIRRDIGNLLKRLT